jgi:Ca-activated chloride channel family protein
VVGRAFRTKQAAISKQQSVISDNESYLQKPENIWLLATQEPLSTFSIDVDTASYSNIRRFLANGQLPPPDAVRIEELLNYFTYDYPQPEGRQPFSVTTEIASCPWDSTHKLLRIGIKGREISDEERPRLSLVFLIDVSGSMDQPNKLPLVISGMKLLLQKLRPDDRVAIVTYAGESKLALKSTPVAEKDLIMSIIDSLRAGGSTNGEGGIRTAYRVARDNFIDNGANRVILCTDGDFNVGNTGEESLAAMVQRQAKSGVFLNVYGFGMGNYKDSRLVQLADQGNGVYGYLDSYAEAQKIFSKQITGTLITIAKDVKIQMDFNPAKVGAYRLIGYEKRLLNKEDFKDDKKDAGEIGSGHTVTALYEIVPPGVAVSDRVDASKYTKQSETAKPALSAAANSEELGTVRLRYKLPKEDSSTPFNVAVSDRNLDYRKASVDFKLAAACAAFGMTLKDSPDRGDADLALALQLAKMGKGEDKDNYRAEFIRLIETAKELKQ